MIPAVGFISGKEVRHHSFEAQGKIAAKSPEESFEGFDIDSLTTHAGVDFEMNGDGADTQSARCGFEHIELPGIPDHRGQLVADNGLGVVGKDSADNENACVRAETAGLNAFFDAGYAKPLSTCADSRRRAESKRMTVGIGFNDCEQFDLRSGKPGKKSGSCLRRRERKSRPSRGGMTWWRPSSV